MAMQPLLHMLSLYLKVCAVTAVLGVLLAAGLWCGTGLGSFAREAREDK
jgi:hypothetical protein